MSETKFTPGPWSMFWERDEEKFIISLPGKDDPGAYVCLATVGGNKQKVGRPNAHLIAAAPDLYARTRAAWTERAAQQGHELLRADDGDVDRFALDNGNHNGPECVRCEQSWCWHCTEADGIPACVGALPATATHTRESLAARVADIVRRSGVADAEQVIALLERFASTCSCKENK